MLLDFMEEVESEKEYDGYYYSLGEALTIVVLGSLCGLKNVSQIHQWAESDRTREWLKETFAIDRIPCYYWLLSLLKMVKPGLTESMSEPVGRPDDAGKEGWAYTCSRRKDCSFYRWKERVSAAFAYYQRTAVRTRVNSCQQKRRRKKQ